MAVTKTQINTLITYFLMRYKGKHKDDPRDFNRFRDQWGFSAMIEQYGMDRSKEIIDYYFETKRLGHPVSYLLYNYEKLHAIMVEKEEDAENRRKLRLESKKRVEEWRGK